MTKHIWIVNPIAGRGAALTLVPEIEAYFKQHPELPYEIRYTEQAGQGTRMAAEYKPEDDVCVYAVGGDGILWEVINGLHRDVPFALIPAGTGNDFFRLIDRSRFDMKTLLADTIEGECMRIDYGVVNEQWRFLNCCCFGLDADVNARVCQVGKKGLVPKKFLYGTSAARLIIKPHPIRYTYEDDAGCEVKEKILTTIMNGRYYGGGFHPTPLADIHDGYLDLCMVDPLSFHQIVPLLPKYLKGTHLGNPHVYMKRMKQCAIHFEEETHVTLDGEMFDFTEMKIRIEEGGLLMKVPKESYHAIEQ